MISVPISGPVPLVYVASPIYLADRLPPAAPDDLEAHRCLCYRHTSSGIVHRWEFDRDGHAFERTIRGDFVTNDVDVMRDAAVGGLGIACLPLPHAERQLADGTLVEVLAGWAPILPPNHLYYPSRRQPTVAFRALSTPCASNPGFRQSCEGGRVLGRQDRFVLSAATMNDVRKPKGGSEWRLLGQDTSSDR